MSNAVELKSPPFWGLFLYMVHMYVQNTYRCYNIILVVPFITFLGESP